MKQLHATVSMAAMNDNSNNNDSRFPIVDQGKSLCAHVINAICVDVNPHYKEFNGRIKPRNKGLCIHMLIIT